MKITIYTKEKGLHNPFNADTEANPHALANFLILCVSRICLNYKITEHQLFSKSREGELPNIRGAIMNFLFKNQSFQRRWKLTTPQIAHLFSKKHTMVVYFSRPETSMKGGEMGYVQTKKDIWHECEKVLQETKSNKVNCESWLFSYQEFLDFAHFLGTSEKKLKDFIKLRA